MAREILLEQHDRPVSQDVPVYNCNREKIVRTKKKRLKSSRDTNEGTYPSGKGGEEPAM